MKLNFFQRRKIRKQNLLLSTYIKYIKNPGKCDSCKYVKTEDGVFGHTWKTCKLKESSFKYESQKYGSCTYHEPKRCYKKAIKYCKDLFYQGDDKNELSKM